MKKLLAAGISVCLLLCGGCTPKPVETQPPAPAVSVPNDPAVKTDWSQLTPYEGEKPIYTRRYEDFTDTLIPASDYGPLVPFLGDKLGGLNAGGRSGLVTLEGEIVVDPVFATVWQGGHSFGYHNNPALPYYMLTRGSTSASRDDWGEAALWAMCAIDGSWCTPFKYQMDGELTTWGRDINSNCTEDGLFVLDGGALVYLDGATGDERLRVEDILSDNLWDALFSAFWKDGKAYYQAEGFGGDYIAVDAATGTRTELTWKEGEVLRLAGRDSVNPERLAWGGITFTEDGSGLRAIGPDGTVLPMDSTSDWYEYRGCNAATGEKYAALPNGEMLDFYNEQGDHFATLPMDWNPRPAGGLFYTVTNIYSGLRTADGEWVFRYPLSIGEWD